MINDLFLTVLLLSISFAMIWYLYFWLYKGYLVDRFRQNMFELRDDLFNEARNGLIDFNHPSYCILRGTMNGMIRYAHDLRMLQLIVSSLLYRRKPDDIEASYLFESQFNKSTENLDEETVKALISYRKKMNKLITVHLLLESPIIIGLVLSAVFITVIPIVALILFYRRIHRWLKNIFKVELNTMESTAFEIGRG